MSCIRQTRRRTYLCNENTRPKNVKVELLAPNNKKPLLRDRTNIPCPVKKVSESRKEIPRRKLQKVSDDVKELKENEIVTEDTSPDEMEVDTSAQMADVSFHSDFEESEDEDEDEGADRVIFVTDYSKDIYSYLRSYEHQYFLSADFMSRHTDITPRMRYILVDWLSKVHTKFDLSLDSFHLTVMILDRYFNLCKSVSKHNLQLIGTTTLLIASKFEEVYPPSISDLCYMTENAVSCQDIRDAEREILNDLNFDLNIPLPIHFYRRFSHISRFTTKQHSMGKYFLELCLVEYDLCHYRPSKLAAAALLLVRLIMMEETLSWTRTLQRKCIYSREDLFPVVQKLARNLLRHTQPSKYRAIRDKYASSSNYCVSLSRYINSDTVVRIAHAPAIPGNERILVPLVMANQEGRFVPLFFAEDFRTSNPSEISKAVNEKSRKSLIISDPPTPLLWSEQDDDIFGSDYDGMFPID